MLMSGIDVSHYQTRVDWGQVQKAGIVFTFVKATEGITLNDPMFSHHWRSAGACGIFRGAYHFFRPQFDPVAQAEQFLDLIWEEPGELPPVLDLEGLGNLSPDRVIAGACRWMKAVEEQLKRKPILYTGSAFWRKTLGNSPLLAEHPLWIAHYTSGPRPLLPSAWSKWTFWQFSQEGRVPGIPGRVDLNAFNGTRPDLDEFCSSPKRMPRKLEASSA
jgi:lysozyme